MRLLKGLATGLVAAGLAGCSVSGSSEPSTAGPSATIPRAVISTAPGVAPASPKTQARARAAAAQFYGLYSAGHFAAVWDLLSPAAKHRISRRVWVSVHDACPSAGAGKARIIKAVTVFGSAAITTEAVAGAAAKLHTAEDVFDYAHGHWRYSPQDLSIYQNGSAAADIAAAKAAGLCVGWKIF